MIWSGCSKPIPKVAQLSEQYAALLAEKQEQYAEYKALRQDMIAYRTAKQNVDKILGLVPEGTGADRSQIASAGFPFEPQYLLAYRDGV